ncbi:MAG: hypothetical protein C4304_05560 [candidate division GAL15 bacterium]
MAEVLHVPRSTVHALLKTLCGAGLLRNTSACRYALGPRLHALASRLAAPELAVVRAQQAAEELVSRWGGAARVVVKDPYRQTAEVFRAAEALAVDLCLPLVVFYGHASRIRASLLSACGHRNGSPSPALPLRALRAGQLAR